MLAEQAAAGPEYGADRGCFPAADHCPEYRSTGRAAADKDDLAMLHWLAGRRPLVVARRFAVRQIGQRAIDSMFTAVRQADGDKATVDLADIATL